jgi:ADP-ribosylglycohydrolase
MDNFSSRVAGVIYGGAAAEAAAINPEGTEYSTGTQLGLYVADGLLEVLEWSAQGEAADPAAAIWLALLRWYKNRYGDFPEGLPPAPARRIDDHPVSHGDVEAATKAGLEEPEMGLPRKPHGVGATGTDALVRAAPLGMLPQVDADWVVKMSQQVAVLTHADWITPTAYSLLMYHVVQGKTLMTAVTEVLSWLGDQSDGNELAQQIRTAMSEEPTAPMTAQQVLPAAIRAVADALEQAVAPEQLFAAAVTHAVNDGGNTKATALVAGQLIGGLMGNTVTGTPSYLTNYIPLEEAVDRWVKLTT